MSDDVRVPSRPPLSAVATTLLLAALVDELCSAAPSVGAPDWQGDLTLSVTGVVLVSSVVPGVVGLVAEPALLWWSDGPRRGAVLVSAGAGWSAGFLGAALAPSAWVLSAALTVAYVCGGVTLGVARAALVASTAHPERALVRWTLFAAVGDLAGPLALAAIGLAGGGWRAAMAGCSVAVGVWVSAVAARVSGAAGDSNRAEGPEGAEESDRTSPSWSEILAPGLLGWLLGVALCTLLDEIFVAGIALYAVQVLDAGLSGAGVLVACEMGGGVLGLALLERVGSPRGVLVPACAASIAGLAATLLAPGPAWAAPALFLCGLGTGAQYPLALAAAHRALPGRPGRVEALQNLFGPLDLLFPLAFGAAADRLGLGWALAALALQPAGLILLVVTASRSSSPCRWWGRWPWGRRRT